jgi:lipid A ethanolaminephosphotransferase
MHYFERYPDEFIKYQPLCLKDFSKCNQEQIFNAYDNTVFYTDYFLDQVIKIADQSNSILFFISDHGSFLGENGIYANGKKVDKNNNEHVVPMFIYFSNMLLKDNFYKQKFLKAQKNSKVEVNPDYFFDSVLGCLGVRSELIDNRKYNLCNDL